MAFDDGKKGTLIWARGGGEVNIMTGGENIPWGSCWHGFPKKGEDRRQRGTRKVCKRESLRKSIVCLKEKAKRRRREVETPKKKGLKNSKEGKTRQREGREDALKGGGEQRVR